MSNRDDIPSLERPSFFYEQRLTAADLTAAQTYNRELRWLHNRSLHSWGIAFGLAVSGARGVTAVRVDTGYAIDCVGRDLVLDEALELPIPSVAGDGAGGPVTYYLTASYAEDEDPRLMPIVRAGDCGAAGAVRRPEMPIVRWQDPTHPDPASRYRNGLDIVLGAIRVQNCQLAADISGRERRDAVPPQQPYVAAGRTDAGATPWRLWPNDKAALGVATTVSTSGAGFQSAPRYQAQVVGERLFQSEPGKRSAIVDGFVQVARAGASSFDVRVILPTGTTAGAGQVDVFGMDDYRAVVSRIASPAAVPAESVLAISGPVLFVGQELRTIFPVPLNLGQLRAADFVGPLKKIAQRNGVSLEALRAANGWTASAVTVGLEQKVAIPGPALAVNPPAVYKLDFMDVLKKEQGWHVVWMGVEG